MPRKGKKIAEWSIEYNTYKTMAIVRMSRDVFSPGFVVEVDEYGVVCHGTDLGVLRREMTARLRELMTIDWKPFIWLCCGGHASDYTAEDAEEGDIVYEATAASQVKVRSVWLGTTADGREVWRDNHGDELSMCHVKDGRPDVGDIMRGWWDYGGPADSSATSSLVPDTPENRGCVQKLLDGINDVQLRLRELYTQNDVDKSLLQLKSKKFLSMIAGTVAGRRPTR